MDSYLNIAFKTEDCNEHLHHEVICFLMQTSMHTHTHTHSLTPLSHSHTCTHAHTHTYTHTHTHTHSLLHSSMLQVPIFFLTFTHTHTHTHAHTHTYTQTHTHIHTQFSRPSVHQSTHESDNKRRPIVLKRNASRYKSPSPEPPDPNSEAKSVTIRRMQSNLEEWDKQLEEISTKKVQNGKDSL